MPDAPLDVIVRPEQIEYILLTIRWMESRETYDIPPNKGGASGAYQYIEKTWANYAGYPEAYLAPPWVQDERAAADVAAILRRYNNDVSVVPIIWYYPAALADPALMDVVPKPEAGNVLTIREYQWRWLDTLAYFMGGPLPPPPVRAAARTRAAVGDPAGDPRRRPTTSRRSPSRCSVRPPSPRPRRVTARRATNPNPAIVYGRKLQPVLAAADGVVTSVVFEDAEHRTRSSSRSPTPPAPATTTPGFNDDTPGTDDGDAPPALRLTALARVGTAVRAGQVIGFLGDSDREPINTSVAPATDVAADGTAATDEH